jgi:hypothetical protein
MEKIMKFITSFLCVFILFSGISDTLTAAGKLQVFDKGLDGNQRIYLVICPDGNRSSVVQTFESAGGKTRLAQVCIYPHSGKDQCRPDWDLDTAAQLSCQ